MKVLLAEDALTSRRMVEALLSKWGYQVITAVDGDQAFSLLTQADPPPLALLDWMMPGREGIEIVRAIRQQERTPPLYLILLTSRDRQEDIVAGLEAGANDYIVKPFDTPELKARVQVGERVVKLQEELATRVRELSEALAHIKTLQGILPICMFCHKIRTDDESWERLEAYISEHSDAHFSHSLCPECLEKHFPEGDEGEGLNVHDK
jgi:DNA-binding response OmpR family regulator